MNSNEFSWLCTISQWNAILFRHYLIPKDIWKLFVFHTEQFLFEEIWWLKDLLKSNIKFVLKTFYCIEHPKKRSLVKKTLIWHQIWLTDWYVWHSYLKEIFWIWFLIFIVKQYFVVFVHQQPQNPKMIHYVWFKMYYFM